MKTKAWLLPIATLSVVIFIAASPKKEKAPNGADQKIVSALPEKPYAKPKAERKILVFSRTKGFRHKSIPTGKLALDKMGEKTGAFTAVISDDLSHFEPENLAKFDAVVFLNTTGNAFKGAENEKQLQDSLMKFIKSGKGFVGIHSATDTFYNWPEYGEMMNGYFAGHPWGAKSNVHIDVEPGKENHPLTVMFEGEPLTFKEEIYQFKDPYDPSNVDMLLRLNLEKSDDKGKKDGIFGVAWARDWGDGRVFYSSIGHNHDMYWHPKILRHYLAGIQWALGDYEAELQIDN